MYYCKHCVYNTYVLFQPCLDHNNAEMDYNELALSLYVLIIVPRWLNEQKPWLGRLRCVKSLICQMHSSLIGNLILFIHGVRLIVFSIGPLIWLARIQPICSLCYLQGVVSICLNSTHCSASLLEVLVAPFVIQRLYSFVIRTTLIEY